MSRIGEAKRERRHLRIRRRVIGTSDMPRMSVFRSLNHMYIQLVDDINGKTILNCSTIAKTFKAKVKDCKNNKDTATMLGKLIAEMSKEKGIKKVVFDRGGYKYHGKIKAIADGAREGGLKF